MRLPLAPLLLLVFAGAADATQTVHGDLPGGATYTIAVPDGWQAGSALVLYQHGFSFDLEDTPSLGPLAERQLAEGYAVAATSYSQRAWAIFRAPDDNRELVSEFTRRFGAPGELVPFGGSLGGLVSLKLAEDPVLRPAIKGVYSLCPPAAGSRVWDRAIDLRLAYDVVCNGAGDLPRGEAPYPWAYDLNLIPDHLSDLLDQARLLPTLIPLNQCTGVNLPSGLRNGAMQRRLASLKSLTRITDDDFFVTNFGYATYALGDLVRSPDKLDTANAFTNRGVVYADPAIDAGIARIDADPMARLRMHWYTDFRGEIGAAKVLSITTSRDELVIPANQDVLRRTLPATRLTSVLVDEDEATHCGFSDAEGLAGWEALRAWKDGAAQPTAGTLQAACRQLVGSGVDGDCRFDATSAVPSFDSVVPARAAAIAPAIDARYSGNWYDPARNGEGVALEILDAQTALMYFFTYPPTGRTNAEQAWVYGVGRITPEGIVFDDVRETYTAGVNPGFFPTEVATLAGTPNQARWGRLFLTFADCGQGQLRWEGPEGWGAKTVPLQRLTSLSGLGCADSGAAVGAQASGSWYDPAYFGTGFHIERIDATHTLVMLFSPLGTATLQGWETGVAVGDPAQGVDVVLAQSYGPRFGDDYNAAALHQRNLLNLHLTLGCRSGTAQLQGQGGASAYSTTMHLQRVTRPVGVADCTD